MKKLSLLLVGLLCSSIIAHAGEDARLADNRLGQLASLAGDVHSFADAEALVNQHIELGLAWYRIALDWLDWREVVDSPRFSNETVDQNADAAITMLHESNVDVMLNLIYWDKQTSIANPPERLYTTAAEIDRYVDYARAIAQHFRGRVASYVLLNEPNVPDPGQFVAVNDYVELVRRVVPTIREADPEAKIVIGEITPLWGCNGLDYLLALLDSDILSMVDGIAWHWGGASPELQTEFYYRYPELTREIRELAKEGGFEGELLAEEITLRTAKTPHSSEYMGYDEMPALKYTLRVALMNLGLDIAAGISFENLAEIPLQERMTQNLCNVMADHEAIDMPVEIDVDLTDPIAYCTFRYSNGDRILAIWTDGIAQDEDPGVTAMITFPGQLVGSAIGIDVLSGFEQELVFEIHGDKTIIPALLVKDYPILVRLSGVTMGPDYVETAGDGFHRLGNLAMAQVVDENAEWIVTSVANSGPGTLRWALETARSGDTITFDTAVFPPDAPATIHVAHVLPSLTQGDLTIDASDAGVILDGQGSTEPNTWGLEIISDGNVVRGLQIVNFTGFGIQIVGGAQHNVIGGNRATGAGPTGQGNLSSGNNGGIGLYDEGTSYNTITGNLIGTDATGIESLGNIDGMFLSGGASYNTIGPDNIISYNLEHAIVIQGASSLGNTITENSIHSNDWGGIQLIDGGNNELAPPLITSFDRSARAVGGTTCPSCAVEIFSDNGSQGKHLEGQTLADETGAFRSVAEEAPANKFLTATATSSTGDTSGFSMPLSCTGLTAAGRQLVVNSSADSGEGTLRWALGIAQPGDVITFDQTIFPPNDPATIYPRSELPPIDQGGNLTIDASNAGVIIDGSNVPGDWNNGLQVYSSHNTVMGLQIVNFKGSGIAACSASYNTIGGDRSVGLGPIGQGNLLSGNGIGIDLCDVGTSENIVLGNLVGVNADGTTPWGNGVFGILIEDNVHDNVIGPGNVIANNGLGIAIMGVGAVRNSISHNSIFRNTEYGIRLSDGANGHLPAPVLIDLELNNSSVIEGSACPSCQIELFSDHGAEGEYFEGRTKADSAGHFVLQEGSPFIGPNLTAVAIDAEGNSSCFSYPVILVSSVLPVASGRGIIVNSSADSGEGTLRWALETAQAGDAIAFNSAIFPPDEPVTILLRSELPPINQGGIMIDASDAGVVLNGAGLSSDEAGVILTSPGNSLQGLEFVNFQGVAIRIRGSGFSNLIGGDSAIGSGPSGQGNVIRSCGTGIFIEEDQTGYNTMTGNFIGTASTGRGNFGNEYGILIDGGRGHNEIGPNNILAYSETADVEIRSSACNVIGPDNTIIQNSLPAIRIAGEASIGNVITQNTLRTTGIVRGYNPVSEGLQCIRRDCVRYSGAFDIDEVSQGGIQRPRITQLNAFEGTISGTTCPGCTVEVFSGSQMYPFVYEGSTTADENGLFDFAKGNALLGREVMLTTTDPERGTSTVGAPLCRTYTFPDSPDDGEVRIMTYNIQGMPEGYFDWRTLPVDEWESVPQWSDFIELIEYASPDILALQEVGWAAEGGRVLHAVAERLGYPYFVIESELAIFSRYEIMNWGEPYGSAEVRLPNEQMLRVVNWHTKSCADEPEEFQWLLGKIGALVDVSAVVLGDFNSNRSSPALHPACFDDLPRQGWLLVSDNWSTNSSPVDSIWVSPMLASYARESRIATLCSINTLYGISDHHPVMMILTVPWLE